MLAYLLCWARGRGHNAVRHPLGGFRCDDCGVPLASLEAGYVSPLRRTFDREHGTFTRTGSWEQERRPEEQGMPSGWKQ